MTSNADSPVQILADFTLFSRPRPDNSTLYYTVPRGLSFVLIEGAPRDYAMTKFQTYVDVVMANPGKKFEVHWEPYEGEIAEWR